MSGQPAARLPELIGRYRILKELGRGMMGVVYLAQDPALERLIALKTIDLAFAVPEAERASFEQRFLAEARVAARLQHPGIVVVHDVGRDDARGILYIALEYLHGRTLSDLVAGGQPQPWREALRIVAALARALHHAHAQSIVHRDIKPANVMLLPSGQPKVMDFGIAKVPHLELTSAGQFFGTPLYMSPEQASGAAVDGRSDLFSLGAVAYQLLTGRQAFRGENVLQVLSRVANDTPPPPSQLVPGLPVAVDRLVARAMAKQPHQRHPSGEDMAREVEALLAASPPSLTDDLPALHLDDDPLAGMLEEAPPPRPPAVTGASPLGTARARTPGPAATLAEPIPLPPRWEQPKDGATWVRRHALWVFGAAALVVLLGLAATRPRSAGAPRKAAAAPSAAPAAKETPRETVPDADATAPPEPEPVVVAVAEGEGRLEVDFEHHLRRGRIQVWVDEDEVLDEQFDSRVTKKILSLRLRKGEVQQVLAIPAGRHEVRVRLSWSGRVRTQRIAANFEDGQTRTLRVRVSRVFNELSLGWQ
jgi:predicted Ser/Thr protein kinase